MAMLRGALMSFDISEPLDCSISSVICASLINACPPPTIKRGFKVSGRSALIATALVAIRATRNLREKRLDCLFFLTTYME